MRTLMKPFGNSMRIKIKKFGRRAMKLHPDVKWSVTEAEKGITDIYGDGFVVKAERDGLKSEYFILADDPRTDKWIHLMAIETDRQVADGR